ncbi:hypothetical protein HK096_002391 [Nowakowskiella sp. JEL0078]|nr:hypothetical protein HK096_002391 [Nowakowskiella sp. JEL0078]
MSLTQASQSGSVSFGAPSAHAPYSVSLETQPSKTSQVHILQSPLLMQPAFISQIHSLHSSLHSAVLSSLKLWWETPDLLPLNPKIKSLFLTYKCPFTSPIGSYRPDFLFDNNCNVQVCEVNARFTLNGYLFSVKLAELCREGKMGDVFPSPMTTRFPNALRKRFDEEKKVYCISERESSHDLGFVTDILDIVVFVHPKELDVVEGKLIYRETGDFVEQCILELHQDEIEALSDGFIETLMELSIKGRCLNPLWTIFIIHDKRWLKTLRSLITPKYILPTSTPHSTAFLQSLYEIAGADLLIKPALFGKGEGIVIGNPSDPSFLTIVEKISTPWIVQPYFNQKKWNVNGNLQAIVGTVLTMDGVCFGAGVFRTSNSNLIALTTGGAAVVPAISSPAPGKLIRVAEINELDESVIESVKVKLRDVGVAVISIPEDQLRPNTLEAMLAQVGVKFREHCEKGSYCWTISAELDSSARSHTLEEFEVHTDASFELYPPRYFALAVKRQDATGAGATGFAKIGDVVQTMDPKDVDILRTVSVKWSTPVEFQPCSKPDIFAPVLFSKNFGRLRRDIIDTTHLPTETQTQFWKAYTNLHDCLTIACTNSKSVLPDGSILLLDNWKYAHSRSAFTDPSRLLYRIRFDLEPHASPLINKKQLLKKLTPQLLTQRGLYWSPSGGTTSVGAAAYNCLPCTHGENTLLRNELSDLLRLAGALDAHVAVNLMSSGHLYRSLEVFQHVFVHAGVTEIPLGFSESDECVVETCRRFDAGIVCGYPSRIVQLCAYLKVRRIELNVKAVLYGGEKFVESHQMFCRSVLKGVKLFGVYGSSETGVFACTKADEKVYCYPLDGIEMDFVDEEGRSTVEGRICVTNKYRKEFPILRYDTQDVGRRVGVDSFEIVGRDERSSKFPFAQYFLDLEEICKVCLDPWVRNEGKDGICVGQIWFHLADDGGVRRDVFSLYFYTSTEVSEENIAKVEETLKSLFPGVVQKVVKVGELAELKRSLRSSKILQFQSVEVQSSLERKIKEKGFKCHQEVKINGYLTENLPDPEFGSIKKGLRLQVALSIGENLLDGLSTYTTIFR